jgi:drug/metabolite transporter (DMT)-like permease
MTWWSGKRRRLDRADKIQMSGMIGFFVIGSGLFVTALVRSFYFPSTIPDRIPYVGLFVLVGFFCTLVGLVFGFVALARTLRRLYRERHLPRVPMF